MRIITKYVSTPCEQNAEFVTLHRRACIGGMRWHEECEKGIRREESICETQTWMRALNKMYCREVDGGLGSAASGWNDIRKIFEQKIGKC